MKKALKFLLAISSLALCTAGVSPLIVSCASTNSKNDFDYDANNQQLEINKSELVFPSANNNLFIAYNNLLATTKTKSSAVINEKLTAIYSQWLNSLGMQFSEIAFDLTNITIDGFSISIPTTIKDLKVTNSNNSQNTPTINCNKTKINFASISLNKINDLIANNTYNAPATQLFPGYSLEDIQKLPEQKLLEKIPSLPNSTTIFKGGENFPLPTYSIIQTNDGSKALRVLIFTPNKSGGLGQILVTQSNLDIVPIQANQEVKNALGDDVQNNWQEVVNKYMIPIPEQTLTSISGTSNANVVTSYEAAQNSSLVTQKIASYTKDIKTFKTNLETDLDFFLKNYLTSLSTAWEQPGLITSGIFTSNNLTIDGNNKLLTGSVAIMLNNSTTGTKKIALPITNQEILVNGNSTLTILIGFNKSSLSPCLVTQDATKNTAYLTTAFSNVSLNVYQSPINNSSEMKTRDSSNVAVPIVSTNFPTSVNVFPYSYAMKTLVTNVGFGNNLISSTSLINESLKKIKVDDLKNLQLNQINTTYQNVLVGVKAAQNLLLKIAENPTLFNFLQDINQDLYSIFYLLTNDANLSSIVSDLFSTKKVSEYLYTNLSKITALIKKLVNTYPQLSTVLNMLETIGNTNQTLAQMQEWVKSIESLYPTLEKLLGANIQWIMPLLKTIMTSLSHDDPSIISLIFNNIDPIFQFLLSTDNASNLDANVVNIIGIFHTYLNSLAEFSAKQINASKDPNKYKNIKVLDILVYELTTPNKDSTLLKSIATVLRIIQHNSPIAPILDKINSMIGSEIKIPSELKDYSSAEWQNKIFLGNVTTYQVKTTTIKKTSLTTQLQKIIQSLVNVTVNDKSSDLYTSLSNNVQTTIVKNDFAYHSSSATVTQNLSVKMNFKETVKFDLMPLLVLLDNVTCEVSLSSPKATTKPTTPETGLTPVSPGAISLSILNIIVATALPTDIVIIPDNYLQLSYTANNAKLRPNVNTNTGMINWAYQLTEQIAIAYESKDPKDPLHKNGVLPASNTQYTGPSKTSKYYGSTYSNSTKPGSKTKFLGLVVDIKGVKITVYLTDFIGFNGGLTNYVTASTNLTNGTVIPNYNSAIYSAGATVQQLKSNTDFTTYLAYLINNYGQWTNSTLSQKPEFSLRDGDGLSTKIKEYFKFGSDFSTNKYVSYEYGFNASQYKFINLNKLKDLKIKDLIDLISNPQKLTQDNYTYTFNLIFSVPVLYKPYGSTTSSLVTNLTFTVTSNQAPKPTAPSQPAKPTNNLNN